MFAVRSFAGRKLARTVPCPARLGWQKRASLELNECSLSTYVRSERGDGCREDMPIFHYTLCVCALASLASVYPRTGTQSLYSSSFWIRYFLVADRGTNVHTPWHRNFTVDGCCSGESFSGRDKHRGDCSKAAIEEVLWLKHQAHRFGLPALIDAADTNYVFRRRSSIQRVMPRCLAARVLLPSERRRTSAMMRSSKSERDCSPS